MSILPLLRKRPWYYWVLSVTTRYKAPFSEPQLNPVQCTWHIVFLKNSEQEYIIVYTDEKLCMISVAECLLFIVVHIQQILVQLE